MLAFLGICTSAFSQIKLTAATVEGGWYKPSLDWWNNESYLNGLNMQFQGGLYFGGDLTLNFAPNLAIRTGIGRYKESLDSGPVSVGGVTRTEKMSLALVPLSGSLVIEIPSRIVYPYLGGGAAAFFVQSKYERNVTGLPAESGSNLGSTLGFHGLAGISVPLGPVDFSLEGRYHYGSYSQQVTAEDNSVSVEKVSFSGPMAVARLGVRLAKRPMKLNRQLVSKGEEVVQTIMSNPTITSIQQLQREEQEAALTYLQSIEKEEVASEEVARRSLNLLLSSNQVRALQEKVQSLEAEKADLNNRQQALEEERQRLEELASAVSSNAGAERPMPAEGFNVPGQSLAGYVEDEVVASPVSPERAITAKMPAQAGVYKIVVGAFSLTNKSVAEYLDVMKNEFPFAGICVNAERGFQYVFTESFSNLNDAILAVRSFQRRPEFEKAWIYRGDCR